MKKRLDVAQRIRAFRERLIEFVIASNYVREVIADDKIDAVAKKIGLHPDVLVEARLRFRLQRRLDGFQGPLGRKKRGTRHYQLKLAMPREIFTLWKDEAERRGLESSALLRSVVHSYLLGSYEPIQVTTAWYWRGKTYKVSERSWEKQKGGRYPFSERALITQGAARALRVRAARRGHVATALTRALVLEVLEGKHEAVRVIDAQTMYDDETRYRTEPGVVD